MVVHPTLRALGVVVSATILVVSCQTRQPQGGSATKASQAPEINVTTNWTIAARAALPDKYFEHGDLSFRQLTNALCREGRLGNQEAERLWGCAPLAVPNGSAQEREGGLQVLRKLANDGYMPAMLTLGLLFEGNGGVVKDYKEAFHWYSMAAEKGNAEAQLHAGGCYRFGFGVDQDYDMADKYYRLSADGTNYVAMKNLGCLYMNGFGLDKNEDAAKYWLKRSANEGNNSRAMCNLGTLYARKTSDPNSIVQAFHWYEQSAKLGDPLACYRLALDYYWGWGVETNRDNWRYWLSNAASLGATEAQFDMGEIYRLGEYEPTNIENALLWYRQAAAKNHPKALYALAEHYLAESNKVSFEMAQRYFLRAAQMGHRDAQFKYAMGCFRDDLGTPDCEAGRNWLAQAAENGCGGAEFYTFQMFYNGFAPIPTCPTYPIDRIGAVKWLRRAVEHKYLRAQLMLAIMLLKGDEMERNPMEAEKLLREAAEHGDGEAQNDLGFGILNGDLGTKDLLEAAKWCRLAVSTLSDPEDKWPDAEALRRARVNFAHVQSLLTAEQQLEADRQANEFKAIRAAYIEPMNEGWQNDPSYAEEDAQVGMPHR